MARPAPRPALCWVRRIPMAVLCAAAEQALVGREVTETSLGKRRSLSSPPRIRRPMPGFGGVQAGDVKDPGAGGGRRSLARSRANRSREVIVMRDATSRVVVDVTVNGLSYQREIEPRLLLVEFCEGTGPYGHPYRL